MRQIAAIGQHGAGVYGVGSGDTAAGRALGLGGLR